MSNEELVELIQKGIDPSNNMGQLYEQNKGMICKIARRYSSRADIEDLMQEAYFGLYEAVKRYESAAEVKFMSYATYWILQSIQRYVENNASSIRIPIHTQQLYNIYSKVVKCFKEKYKRKPTDQEASRLLDTSITVIQSMRKELYEIGNMNSLDQVVGGENDDMFLSDTVIGSNGIENDIVDKIVEQDKKGSLWGIVEENTSEIENQVIVSRYRKDLTLEATGKEIGISRDRVRQMETRALRKLQSARVKRTIAERYEIAIVGAYRGSVGSFNHTWTSSTERAALKLEEMR
ncbi:sigma-70 family RNA polymerase sigma factor [Anaerosporobacter faecicola]|uniref:sigma-70 family RNA polymerase sigma factor n=1 Tax=Anaerosporobacter faecicola TaxID=2718714 RepID=UPI00143A6C88|nr:sigma-70 family RNA polymerase sigma factor [Anaerosporobacter faecicola]